jgi:hypothetical protein
MGGLSATSAVISVNTTGITNNKRETITNNSYFDLQGRQLPTMQRGLNIVRSADGTTRKVIR